MNHHEEIFLIANLLKAADQKNNVDFANKDIWKSLFLSEDTQIHEDYFLELNEKGIIDYEEIGEEGFAPIIMCSVKNETREYLKELIISQQTKIEKFANEINDLNKRITEILTFNPNKLSFEISKSKTDLEKLKEQLSNNPLFNSLKPQIDEIEKNLNSVDKVATNYEDVYKNIILPVKKEGESGVKQTVKWAIISIVISSIISGLISWIMK